MLDAENLNTVEWWVDASFEVHPNMCSHTLCLMMLGAGAVYASSTKHNLNTCSSTEAEFVGLFDAKSQFLWTQKFLAVQGFDNSGSIIETTALPSNARLCVLLLSVGVFLLVVVMIIPNFMLII